jgi:uncharacterized LabA/DUF88 family protein
LTGRKRVMAYVDGFNLYYGLKNASQTSDREHVKYGGDPAICLGRSLYWLDLHRVILSKIKGEEECVGIKYFSAPRRLSTRVKMDPEKRAAKEASNARQRVLFDALRTLPLVQIIEGWYAEKSPHVCGGCDTTTERFEEKGTDVNIADQMIVDAYEDRADIAMVMSADGDLVAPVATVQRLGKEVRLILPPGRKKADQLKAIASECQGLTIKAIRGLTMPDAIPRQGLLDIRRPKEWTVPGGWVWDTPMPTPEPAKD